MFLQNGNSGPSSPTAASTQSSSSSLPSSPQSCTSQNDFALSPPTTPASATTAASDSDAFGDISISAGRAEETVEVTELQMSLPTLALKQSRRPRPTPSPVAPCSLKAMRDFNPFSLLAMEADEEDESPPTPQRAEAKHNSTNAVQKSPAAILPDLESIRGGHGYSILPGLPEEADEDLQTSSIIPHNMADAHAPTLVSTGPVDLPAAVDSSPQAAHITAFSEPPSAPQVRFQCNCSRVHGS